MFVCTLDSVKAVYANVTRGKRTDFEPIKPNNKDSLCKDEKAKLDLTIIFPIVI